MQERAVCQDVRGAATVANAAASVVTAPVGDTPGKQYSGSTHVDKLALFVKPRTTGSDVLGGANASRSNTAACGTLTHHCYSYEY